MSKLLARDPEDRYQRIKDLLVDLRSLQNLAAPPIEPARVGKKRMTTRRALILGGTLALVAVLFVLRSILLPEDVSAIDSIAVLPLENLSADPSQEYFADGMTEALIADLAKIGTIKVISRTSVMRYKDTDKSLPEIAGELDVDAVVEGSVLLTGGRVRITAQLIDAARDHHLWAEQYERDLRDVLDIQREVAQAIAGEINVTLTPQEEAELAGSGPVDPDAYEAYLRARYHWNKRTREDLDRCMAYIERAIEIDPDYALAHAHLAEAYVILGDWGWFPPREMYLKAESTARKALELDPRLAEAYAAIGAVEYECHYDFARSEEAFLRAIELKPNYATAHQWYSEMLRKPKRMDEALEQINRALELDPLSLIINYSKAMQLYYIRRYDEAIEHAKRALELEETFYVTKVLLVFSLLLKGDNDAAVAEFSDLLAIRGFNEEQVSSFEAAYRQSGIRGADRWMIGSWPRLIGEKFNIAYFKAVSFARLEEVDSAFVYLGKLHESGSSYMMMIDNEPMFDILRSDPRYSEYIGIIGLE
jgi:TolB-like protein/Tfp pilus assembly protein PilF